MASISGMAFPPILQISVIKRSITLTIDFEQVLLLS